MQTLSKTLKYYIFTLALIFASFFFSHSAFATDTNYSYNCLGGGIVSSTAGIVSSDNIFNPGVTFSVRGQITSSCSTRNIKMVATNSSGGNVVIIDQQIINGDTVGFINKPDIFSTLGTAGNYSVSFVTSVWEQTQIYVRVSTVSSSFTRSDANPGCGPNHGVDYFYDSSSIEKADFYSDPAGTIPYSVTGLGLCLSQNFPSDQINPTPIVGCLGPLSGTSVQYEGWHEYTTYTDQYGPSSCDIQYNYGGASTNDGAGLAVPYTLIP
jgi:hypothetical protein